MPRAATDVMQSIMFSAILDGIAALKRASGGLPNQLLRDVQAIHPNVTFADLPRELQDQIAESTRAAFTALLKEGYAVGPDRKSTRLNSSHLVISYAVFCLKKLPRQAQCHRADAQLLRFRCACVG